MRDRTRSSIWLRVFFQSPRRASSGFAVPRGMTELRVATIVVALSTITLAIGRTAGPRVLQPHEMDGVKEFTTSRQFPAAMRGHEASIDQLLYQARCDNISVVTTPIARYPGRVLHWPNEMAYYGDNKRRANETLRRLTDLQVVDFLARVCLA